MNSLKSIVTSAKQLLSPSDISGANVSPGRHTAIDATLLSCGYVLGELIGEGSYANVYKAQSQTQNRPVAIKITIKSSAPKQFLNHFLPREIDVVKRLRHPNILRYYQCIETNHRFFISMEYAANGSVLDLLMQWKRFNEPLGRQFFGELIAALAYLHRFGVVHRDVKLENLLLTDDFEVKLCDFGFSRRLSSPTAQTMQQPTSQLTGASAAGQLCWLSNTWCGSHAYASPEVLQLQPYDPKLSDVWAAGVVLYTMVSGCFPFDDRCMAKLLEQVKRPLVFWPAPALTDECQDLLRHILAPIEQRYTADAIGAHPWMVAGGNDGLNVKQYIQDMHLEIQC